MGAQEEKMIKADKNIRDEAEGELVSVHVLSSAIVHVLSSAIVHVLSSAII